MSNWAHRIPFNRYLEREQREFLFDWLNENLGHRPWDSKVSWRWNAEGGKKDHDWFCFRSKKDAMMFKLACHDVLAG